MYVMTPPRFELRQLANVQGLVGGVAVDANSNVYVCNATKRSVMRVSPKGEVSGYCDKTPEGPVLSPNYGLFDAKGNYWFSDCGDYWKPNGRLVRVKPNRQAESMIGGNWHFPNGLAVSPRDGAIFMIESTAADIIRVPVNKDGTVGTPEIYVQLHGHVMDGLAFAKSGNLYVSCYYPYRIYTISPDRNTELLIEDTTGEILNQPTNIAFEPKGTRLFFANLGGLHVGAFDVGEKGAPLYYPKL